MNFVDAIEKLNIKDKKIICISSTSNIIPNPKALGYYSSKMLLKKNFNGYVIDSLGNEILWINNSDGFRNEKEFSRGSNYDVLRILSLGGSFTGGFRIGQTKTFSFLIT